MKHFMNIVPVAGLAAVAWSVFAPVPDMGGDACRLKK